MRTSPYAVFYLLFKSGLDIKELYFWIDGVMLYIDTPVGELVFEYEDSSILSRSPGESDVILSHEYFQEDGGTFYTIHAEGYGSQFGHERATWDSIDELTGFTIYSPKK
jgi:hypothetical protein